MSELEKQSELVKQRLEYHFRGTDGTWIFPSNLPFMKEFLNTVDKLCTLANGAEKGADQASHIQNVIHSAFNGTCRNTDCVYNVALICKCRDVTDDCQGHCV